MHAEAQPEAGSLATLIHLPWPMAAPSPSRFRLEPGRRALASERRRLRHELETATASAAFDLQFQPRLCLTTGEATGAEALVRWPHSKRGVIPPAAFLPLAEEYGQITAIGGWALTAACVEARGWEVGIVSLNVAARQLSDGALLGQVAEALETSGLQPERLELELSESVLVDADGDTLLVLSAIRDLGVGIALDEFGGVYGSLSTLRRLPLTALKLDRSLVRDLPADPEDVAIVRAVVAAAHALGLCAVAEGVESEQQRACLAALGCDEGQGHLLSHPLPASQLRARFELGG